MPIQLRPIKLNDWPEILAIQAQCYTELEPESLAVLQNKVQLGANTCFAITHKNLLIGYCLAHPWKKGLSIALNKQLCGLDETDCLYLHDIALLPSAQGLGIGERVLNALIDAAHQLALDSICLVAVQGAQHYWRRHGFSPQQTQTLLAHKQTRSNTLRDAQLMSYPKDACPMSLSLDTVKEYRL
ncbi:GNAT family N-acetyltransferase [Shewanella sp. SR44-3]|uniref:GNAT family N-acetyltransferase n=1 Tax=Shewanella sp. SR44-3 TaxID=2760936 RepID=UPI0028737A95|nr:GNAT family N-acetyltransferase [Shewanella sp. SR44-3]